MAQKPAAIKHGAGSPEKHFGRVLADLRKKKSLSQEALGFATGYHRTFIGMLERGERSPTLRTIFNLSATLAVRPSELIRLVERKQRG